MQKNNPKQGNNLETTRDNGTSFGCRTWNKPKQPWHTLILRRVKHSIDPNGVGEMLHLKFGVEKKPKPLVIHPWIGIYLSI